MSNLKRKLIITLSALFAVVLCVALIFSIRPTYASSVEILDTDGTSIYISGEGVTYDKNTNKYTIENGSNIRIQIFNEQRIFSSVKINDEPYSKSVIDIDNVTTDLKIDVYSTAPNADGSDKGRYFTNPFVISEDSQLKALEALLAGRSTSLDDYAKFKELGTVTEANKSTALDKLQTGYFVLSENILLDTNEFYGIGTKTRPFAGCFDFRGYHVTLNILNEYKVDYDVDDKGVVYSGLFGYVNGNGINSSMLKDIDVNGKIAFSGTTGDYNMYHYVGSIAGHVEPTTLLAGAHSETSITLENDTPLFIGGLFGCLKSPLNERFDFTYACNYGVLQAKSHGSSVNMSLGSLAGLVQDTFIYNFEDKSISTHIVANNLGRDEYIQDSGTSVVGGIIGTVYANESDVKIKNVKMNIAEGKVLTALIDSNSTGEYAVAGGVFGIFDSANSKKIYTDMVTVNVSSGTLEIKASTNEETSYGSVYAAGFVGKLETTGHELTYKDKLDATLFNGNVDIKAINSGVGPAYAGGMFSYNALIINNDSDNVEDMNKIVVNSGINDSTLSIIAEQAQTSKKVSYNSLYEVISGYYCGRLQNHYSLNNFQLDTVNSSVVSQRSIGSTAIGNVFSGGFAGQAISDCSQGAFTNMNINLQNSSVKALSLSYESNYNYSINNNAAAGGFIGYVLNYGSVNNTNFTNESGFTWGTTSKGIDSVNLVFNNYGANSPEFTVHCIQNSASGSSDYYSEGYSGGCIGLFDGSYINDVTVKSINESALIYYNGTNTPNTASAGGLIGQTRDSVQVGIRDIEIHNLQVVAKAYAYTDKIGNDSPTDIYVGGAVGTVGTQNSNSSFLDDIHVFNTIVRSIGEEKMSTYAGGVVGGIWWNASSYLQNSSFVSGYVYASSITQNASAGGILGFSQRGRLYNNVVLNSYVNAVSNRSTARAAGVCGETNVNESWFYYNYSQSYVSASGSTTYTNGVLCSGGTVYSGNNLFDLASFSTDLLSKTNVVNTSYGNYIVLYENNNVGYSSLELYNRATGSQISEANIYTSIGTDNNRFYKLFEGDVYSDTNTAANITSSNNVTNISAIKDKQGLVVSSLWINIKGQTTSGVSSSDLTEENGWYSFCSYAIIINGGRPSISSDELNISLTDALNSSTIHFEYEKDSNGDAYVEDGAYEVTSDTNVAGYYTYSNGNVNTQYLLINMDQTGLSPNDTSHVANSIKIKSLIENKTFGYQNFAKYSFYESKSTANIISPTESLWTVPYVDSNGTSYKTLFENRINSILSTNGNKTYSSNFNGRLSVDRLLNEYALVITPDTNLASRTVITISFENPRDMKTENVILEFVPNVVSGLEISPAEDTPALNIDTTTDRNSDGKADTTYVYVAGDTVRFEAFEKKRYNQFSFLSTVIFEEDAVHGLKTNGTMVVPDTNDIIPVKGTLLSDTNVSETVYVKVLSPINFKFNSTGSNHSSDRKAVQTTPFNFEFSSAPGFGLAPNNVIINTYSNDNYTTSIKSLNLANYTDAISYSTTNSYKFDATGDSYKSHALYGFIVEFDHRTGVYSVTVPGSMLTTSVKSMSITLEFPVTYSLIFDTGIPNVDVNERYIVFEMKQGDKIDNLFYTEIVFPTVFAAIKDDRFGFSLHDYYLTDDASSIPRYGETIATMVTPKTVTDDDGKILYYCFIDTLGNEIRVVQNTTTKIWYLDSNNNNVLDATETEKYDGWRTITSPYTFYARWTYDIAVEVPDGVTISSPLASDRVVELDSNDEDKVNGKKKIVPINTNNGFSFTITTDSSFYGDPRFKLFEVTLASDEVTYVYKDLTSYVSLIVGSTNSYIIPQYDDLGNSIINGVLFLKVFDDVADYEVSDIGEFGKVSNDNSFYEDGIFTVTYNVNYSKVVVGDVIYSDGLVVGNNLTSGERGLSFVFTDSNGNALKLPKDTSLRLYRNINGAAYDAGNYLILEDDGSNSISVSSFTNILTGGKMTLASGLKVKSEEYNLVVTLPKNYSSFANDFINARISIFTDYAKGYRQFDYTLTYGYDENGELVAIHPESYDVLKSPIRHSAFTEKVFDIFNIYSYTPASGLVNRVSGTTEATSGFTLQFTPSSGKQPNIFDHRHGSSYYLWEVEKTYSTDVTGASVIRQYTAKDAAGTVVSIVSETQHHYYYLATIGNFNLLNVPSGCTIRLLEVDSITNPAAGVVIYTYSAN